MTEWIITSSVLTALVILMRHALRGKIGLRLQYGLWLLVLVRLLVPVSFGTSPASVLAGAEQVQRAGNAWVRATVERLDQQEKVASEWTTYTMESTAAETTDDVPGDDGGIQIFSTINATSWGWIIGVVLLGGWFLAANLRFDRRLRQSRQPLTVDGCPLPVYETAAVETPCLFGLLHPAVYLTPEAAADERTLRYAVAHEVTHYRHKDHIWAVLRCAALALHWYNPLVWWAAFLSRRDGELACDEATVARLGEDQRAAYGRTLIAMSSERPARLMVTATTMTDGAQGLKERIQLLAKRPKTTLGIALVVVVLAAVVVGCTFTGVEEETPPVGPEIVEEQPEPIEDGRTPELEEALEWLQNDQVQMALRIDNGVHSLYPGHATPNGAAYAAALGQYHYEPVEADVASSASIYILPASETANGSLVFYDDTDYVELILDDGVVQRFEATGQDTAVGDLARLWFDEAEFYNRVADGAQLYNQGQDQITAAQAFCRVLEDVHQTVSDGSYYRYEFVRCVAETTGEKMLGENEWEISIRIVFVPENEDAREAALEAGAASYEGDDPTIPTGAYAMQRWVRIIRTDDGWRGALPEALPEDFAAGEKDGRKELTAVLEQLEKEPTRLALLTDVGVIADFNAPATINGSNRAAALAEQAYEPVEPRENSGVRINVMPIAEGENWQLTYYDDSDYVTLTMGENQWTFLAEDNVESLHAGDIARMWYDEAEFDAVGGGYDNQNAIVIPNTGQDYLAAAQSFCEALEGKHLDVTNGSCYQYTFVQCTVSAAEEMTQLRREQGQIGENTWAFSLVTVFVPGNQDAWDMAMAGNTRAYEGDDPAVPDNAWQYGRCGYITLEDDGWHGELTGTGW